MKQQFVMLWCVTLLFFPAAFHARAQSLDHLEQPLSRAMATLDATKGDPGLLVLTNAPFVKTGGRDSLAFLSQVQEVTGAMVGRGNLLFFQRPQNHPLCITLFKKSGRRAVIICAGKPGWTVDVLNLGVKTISDPEFWKTAREKYPAGRDLFTLATMANAWAEGAPYDFLKAAELHNHICPGLTSGYLMARYILEHYPLAPGERYTIVGCPVWCKEDAFQVVMDCTPGKRCLVVKPLSEKQKEKIAVDNPAGFLLIWNSKEKTGKGVVLSFDFNAFKALYPEKTPKAATVITTVRHLKAPERFVSVFKVFDLDEAKYNAIRQAGTNPYEVTGLMSR